MVDSEALDIEAMVRRALDATGVPYEIVPCDSDFADTAAFCAKYGFTPEQSVNTIQRLPGATVIDGLAVPVAG